MRPALVVDASVALKWFVAETDGDIAERLLGETETLHAPELLKTELANGLWSNFRKRTISSDQAKAALATIGHSVTRWHSVDELLPQALAWAVDYNHPVYDFCYVALARLIGVEMVTADQRLLRKLEGTSVGFHVKALSELR